MHYKLIYTSLIISALLYPNLQAQVSNKSYVRNLPKQTEVWLRQAFEIPALKKSVLLDNGDGKICSCQFFTQEDSIDRVYEQGKSLRIRNITIKGLFDGSQMHVARIYFEQSSSYFKFKCYSREITIQQLQDYITIGEHSIASEE
jgi:hypothetical protein